MLPPDPAAPSASPDAATPSPSAAATPSDAPDGAPTLPVISAPPPVPSAAPRRSGLVLAVAMALVAVMAGGALFVSGLTLGRQMAEQPGTPADADQAFQPFWDTYRAITDRYAGGPIDQKKLIEGAIKGMVDAVGDPYSSYLTSEEYKATLQGLSGEFEGIGAEIGTKRADGGTTDCSTLGSDCRLVVVTPVDGSPALKAGIKAGDVVTAVDGVSLDGLTVDAARDKIRGKKGTTVTLTVVRGTAAPIDVAIVRDVIKQKEVVARDLAGGTVGYVRLTGFSENGAADVTAALKKDIAAGETRLILDLRGNPGGFVTAARTVASQFIASGNIFWEEDAKGTQTPTTALPDGVATDPKLSVVVLIDRGSASASEIVAGALQDSHRAKLIGETSFGKGTVQQWTDLGNDSGGFKLTIAKWLTPDKRWIHHVGLVPDVPVTVPTDTPAGADPVLDKALQVLGATASTGDLDLAA